MGWQPYNTKCVYWFIRVKLDLEKIYVDKKTFSDALKAEGIPVGNEYRTTPFEQKWYRSDIVKKVLKSKKNNNEFNLKFSNVDKVLYNHINIFIRESYSDKEIKDILNAIKKVEKAYLK